ncbi:MAG: ATP-binding protein [Desulfococcaceae bacterium]
MREQLLQIQVLFEIATAIGNHLDERRMLRESLSAYLRKLTCCAGGIFQTRAAPDGPTFAPLFCIPRKLERNPGWTAALRRIPDPMPASDLPAFLDELPLSGAAGSKHFFHLFPLPDFGLLLLVKHRRPLDESILHSLKPLNLKLARSCTACAQSREIERVNAQLIHEVRERRRAEGALRALTNQLERRVAEGTRELREANRKLREDAREQRRLEEKLARSRKMEALGLLAGGVAHDLNNVLSGIVGYPDLLLADLPPDSAFRPPLEEVLRSGKKATAIVEDLLTLARRGVTRRDPADLNAIVREHLASPEYRKLLEHHPQLEVETHLTGDLPSVLGSPVHLKKTVMNLLSNAAEAQARHVRVETGFRRVDGPVPAYDAHREGDFAVLRVADDGGGISTDDLPRIFEPFYTKKMMGRSGTGLGMAVVWGTVKDHGGFINVESREGEGTRFELYFPAAGKPAPSPNAGIPAALPQGDGERVLVVDDVPEQREIAQAMLERLGYRVETAPGGEAALERIGLESFDLLMLDMIMDPGIDGLETFLRVRDVRPDQRALIASGYAETDRVCQALRSGARGFLRKPYTLEQLAGAVREALGEDSGAAERVVCETGPDGLGMESG